MIDLHVHSVCSDGTLTPEELAAEAAMLGLRAVALTDHDTCEGVERFAAACQGTGVEAINGVELSAEMGGMRGSLHMLGYFIDPSHPVLCESLSRVRHSRTERNAQILDRLAAEGMIVCPDRLVELAGEGVVGRLHIAQAMLEAGHIRGRDEAFNKWLAKGQPCYVDRYRLEPVDCVRMIRGAGGVAVLAHPGTLELNTKRLRELLRPLVDAGLAGIEVIYAHHTDPQIQRYRGLVREFGLCETGGTDYHGAHTPDITMGKGFGTLKVPDTLLEQLKARRP